MDVVSLGNGSELAKCPIIIILFVRPKKVI